MQSEQQQEYRYDTIDDQRRLRQEEGRWHDHLHRTDIVLVRRLQQIGLYLEGISASWYVAVSSCPKIVGTMPVVIVTLQHVLVVYTMLQLIVQGSETEGELSTTAGQLHASAAGDVVVEVLVQTRTLYLVVDEEVGDLQLQQRSARGHQFLQVYHIVTVECSEEQVAIAQGDGITL